MIKIVKSLLGSNDIELYNELKLIMSPDNIKTLAADEVMVFKYLISEFDANKQFPTDKVFVDKFEQYTAAVAQTEAYDKTNLKYYRRQFINKKQNLFSGRVLQKLSTEAISSGITPEMFEEVRKLATSEDTDEESKLSFRERYTRSMLDNSGLKTFVDQIDDQIGSITKGSVCTLAGFTGSFKTTWAVNMAVKNAMAGKNIAYISLEVTKEQLEYSILSLFSTDQRFSLSGYSELPHQKIRQNKLTQDEVDFLCDVLEPEYRRVIEPNLHILDESKFKTFSESEILDVLYKLDDEKPLDAVFFDHAGLFAFKSPLYNAGNVGVAINKYVSFIREISICFRKKNGENRGLSSVLLAQTNRSGFKEAAKSFRQSGSGADIKKKSGNPIVTTATGYQLTALSDANELERCSSVVMSVFANDDMKYGKCVKVQLLKTRYGEPLPPIDVHIEPEFYKFGGDASIPEQELSADAIADLSSCRVNTGSAGTSITVDDDYGL